MISSKTTNQMPTLEPVSGRPEASGEQWLTGSARGKRRLWERLNPRHRKQLRLLAQALVLRQAQARLPDGVRAQLLAAAEELERLATRLEKLLAVAERHPRSQQ